jgi:hypothetical protein
LLLAAIPDCLAIKQELRKVPLAIYYLFRQLAQFPPNSEFAVS